LYHIDLYGKNIHLLSKSLKFEKILTENTIFVEIGAK